MRGVNKVILSGNVGDRITFGATGRGVPACSFSIASDRVDGQEVVTAWVRINLYGNDLVQLCQDRLKKGSYVLVSGELMNRSGRMGELTEVRAQEIVFLDLGVRKEPQHEQDPNDPA